MPDRSEVARVSDFILWRPFIFCELHLRCHHFPAPLPSSDPVAAHIYRSTQKPEHHSGSCAAGDLLGSTCSAQLRTNPDRVNTQFSVCSIFMIHRPSLSSFVTALEMYLGWVLFLLFRKALSYIQKSTSGAQVILTSFLNRTFLSIAPN